MIRWRGKCHIVSRICDYFLLIVSCAIPRGGVFLHLTTRCLHQSNPQESTFLESCGVADLITTCYGGRNRKIGVALATSEKSVVDLEAELLGGQSAQGVLTAGDVFEMLHARGLEADFPIFTMVHRICQRQEKASLFIKCIRHHPAHRCIYNNLEKN
ncbi:unnamed protein product [Hydatigera taeniaeformis]|uniref:glycerol-3-phosphate dehydrogenase (NAD(+)) n=1 Tax=Hydatigena taeniaeformis TaxID=6205 RepID=A0A0R3WV04_HYDTA|nr:unnamed protein product [Hydatigera taeniaeformis]